MFASEMPNTPEADLIHAIIMQAYRDLFITVRSDGASSFTTQADQDQAISFLTDQAGSLARSRNSLCSLIGWDGEILAARIRGMMEGNDFPLPSPDPSPTIISKHEKAVESIRKRWQKLKSPRGQAA